MRLLLRLLMGLVIIVLLCFAGWFAVGVAFAISHANALGVEAQQVVLGEAEAADGCVGF